MSGQQIKLMFLIPQCKSGIQKYVTKVTLFYIIITCMMGTKVKYAQSMEVKHAQSSFRLTPLGKSQRRWFPEIQVDVGSFITEIRQNSTKILAFSKQGAFDRPMAKLSLNEPGYSAQASIKDALQASECLSITFKSSEAQSASEDGKAAQIYAAYPTTNRCIICKEEFQNYFQHISTAKHRKNQVGGAFIVGNKKVPVEQSIQKLINSVTNYNRRVPKETSSSNSNESPLGSRDFLGIDYEDGTPSKRRHLSNGISVYVKSSQSKSLANSTTLPRKSSFFEE